MKLTMRSVYVLYSLCSSSDFAKVRSGIDKYVLFFMNDWRCRFLIMLIERWTVMLEELSSFSTMLMIIVRYACAVCRLFPGIYAFWIVWGVVNFKRQCVKNSKNRKASLQIKLDFLLLIFIIGAFSLLA